MSKATDIEQQVVDDWNNNRLTPVTHCLKKNKVVGEAIHIGKKQYVAWSDYKPKKSYGKTDIVIGTHRISLKSTTEHILMSAKKDEAINTFLSVSNSLYPDRLDNIVDDIVEDISKLVTAGVLTQSIIKARKSGDSQIIKADENHRELLDQITEVFNDPVFYTYFVKEALSGELKFGKDCEGSATHLLHITGSKPIFHSVDDMNFISKLASNIQIRVDFKSARKVQGPERGMYRFWSVIQLVNKSLLEEGLIYESVIGRLRSLIMDIITYIKRKIQSWQDIFDFLEVEPVITIKFKG